MKRMSFVMMVMAIALAVAACSLQGTGNDEVTGHPSLSEQDKLVSCRDCHKQATPEVYNEWYNASHGINNVKCYQCHGTYENFASSPPVDGCQACHANKMGEHSAGQTCWECHTPHTFKIN